MEGGGWLCDLDVCALDDRVEVVEGEGEEEDTEDCGQLAVKGPVKGSIHQIGDQKQRSSRMTKTE